MYLRHSVTVSFLNDKFLGECQIWTTKPGMFFVLVRQSPSLKLNVLSILGTVFKRFLRRCNKSVLLKMQKCASEGPGWRTSYAEGKKQSFSFKTSKHGTTGIYCLLQKKKKKIQVWACKLFFLVNPVCPFCVVLVFNIYKQK